MPPISHEQAGRLPVPEGTIHRATSEIADEERPVNYDIDLFERLNEEYRDRPIQNSANVAARRQMLSPVEQDRTAAGHADRIRYANDLQLKSILNDIDVTGRVVLDLGCGHGYMAAALVEHAGAERAIGVDIRETPSWPEHQDPRLSLVVGDMSKETVVAPESVDVVVSQVVFEHVNRPVQMLAAIYSSLKEGGAAWLRMNIYTARNASHAYNEVFFPWPHLLFEDTVLREFYRRNQPKPRHRFSWVNRMTVAHYLHVCREIGFDVVTVRRKISPIDVPFYLRFEDKLGRYQALDLETDFLTLVLTKGTDLAGQTAAAIASVNYLDRQRDLDVRIDQHLASKSESAAD
jgi:2-polyprenyl-3-methyl-5-hydroxy-6-metoxy-1,4-benzoquinol methylase